jgi:hypothetical protein
VIVVEIKLCRESAKRPDCSTEEDVGSKTGSTPALSSSTVPGIHRTFLEKKFSCGQLISIVNVLVLFKLPFQAVAS